MLGLYDSVRSEDASSRSTGNGSSPSSSQRLTLRGRSAAALRETANGTNEPTIYRALSDSGIEGRALASVPPSQDDFAVVSTLGEGGMGRVQLARQRSLARDVAVKTVKPGATAEAAEALHREARIIGALEHPGIVPIYVLAFDESGQPMLVMKRVDGVDLETLLADKEHAAWKARGRNADHFVASLEILIQVCLTLEFAHSRGIVHRDVKPKNIMVGSFGEVYLLDWGIATTMNEALCGDLMMGTPACMPPEMALGEPADQRTDVYLLGATLHEILTGEPRHHGKTVKEALKSAIVSEPFAYAASVPEELASLCNRAMSRKPSARPASVEIVREEISAFIRSRSSRALTDAAFERLVELDTLLEPPGVPEDLARAYRLVTEARFGFALNLQTHGPDPTVQSGMRRCLELAIELELRQNHAESAQALFREMEAPDQELAKRIEDVRERTATYARERARLERLEHELDPTQHAWRRSLYLVAFCVVGLFVGRTITLGGTLSPERITAGAAMTTLLFSGGLVALRRRIVWNAFNKQLIALVITAMLMVVAHRLIAVAFHTPAGETMTIDLVIAGGLLFFAAYAFIPRLVFAAVPGVVGIAAALLWPSHAPVISVAALALSVPVAALVLKQVERRASRQS